MDIVEFIEKLYGISLTDYQKKFVCEVYHALENGKRIKRIIPPRYSSKCSLTILSHIVYEAYKNERR